MDASPGVNLMSRGLRTYIRRRAEHLEEHLDTQLPEEIEQTLTALASVTRLTIEGNKASINGNPHLAAVGRLKLRNADTGKPPWAAGKRLSEVS